MNRYCQKPLFVDERSSFSRRSPGKSVCYAMLLITASWISWVPTVHAQFMSHTGWSTCARNADKKCKSNDNECKTKQRCADCKYYAIDIRTPKNSPKLVTWYEQYCPADVEALKQEYAGSSPAR